MSALQRADNGLEQLDGLQFHDVTVTRGEGGTSSAYIARCSGCTWAIVGRQSAVRTLVAHHESTGE